MGLKNLTAKIDEVVCVESFIIALGDFYKDVMFLEQLLRVGLSGVETDLHSAGN